MSNLIQEDSAGSRVIRVHGEAMFELAGEAKRLLLDALADSCSVQFDLAASEEIDLSFTQVLISACRTFRAHGLGFEVTDQAGHLWDGWMKRTGMAGLGKVPDEQDHSCR